jgi:hypothetical protein
MIKTFVEERRYTMPHYQKTENNIHSSLGHPGKLVQSCVQYESRDLNDTVASSRVDSRSDIAG